jgi:hypothetical protein
VVITYAEQNGGSGTVPPPPGVSTTRTTTVTLETATENATIYYVEDGSTMTNLGSVKSIPGSSGEITMSSASGVDSRHFVAVAVGPGMLPSPPVEALITVQSGTIEGTWSGVVHHTYYCEGGPSTIELQVTGSTITVSAGSTYTPPVSGSITQGADRDYTFDLAGIKGQIYTDAGRNYALFVAETSPGSSGGYVGLLQKGSLSSATYNLGDLAGSWSGQAVRLSPYAVTTVLSSSATISGAAALNGTDTESSFSAAAIELHGGNENFGVYASDWSNPVTFVPGGNHEAMYVLSNDKTAMAVAFLLDDGSTSGGICDTTAFGTAKLPLHKFALWIKQ